MPEHTSADNLRLRLRWLGQLRSLAAAGIAAFALLVHFVAGLALPWAALLGVAAAAACCNGLYFLWLQWLEARRGPALTFEELERLANLEIALDLVFLTAALHYSGGMENPFIVAYSLPPLIASILLTPRSAYLQAAWATALLLGMALVEALLPAWHHSVAGYLPQPTFREPLILIGEVGAVIVAVHASVYLAGALARRLHERERQLRAARDSLQAQTAELDRINRELRALEEGKSRFLTLAAHQLRGPLAATESCLAACDGYAHDPARQAELLRRARARIQAMMQTIRDLLTLARTQELGESARLAHVPFAALAARVVEQYLEFAASRQVDLVYHPGDRGAWVLGDEKALADALGNLVSNAVKYAREGGHVKVSTRQTRGEVICEVVDDGIGIPEAEKANLFREFFRARNARASGQEGTGLGLVIVREIVEKHGGRVTIESLEHLGTCAIISLPLAPPPSAPRPAEA